MPLGRWAEAQQTLLDKLAEDKSESSRRAVLAAFGWIGDESVVPVLLEWLTATGVGKGAPAAVRTQAAVALGNLFDPAPRRAITRLDDNFDCWVDHQQFFFDFLRIA